MGYLSLLLVLVFTFAECHSPKHWRAMILTLVCWLGMSLEAVLLARGLKTKLASRFPLFYSYVLVVLLQDVLRYIVYVSCSPAVYANVYWSTQFVSLVMGSIVIFEIYRLALQKYPGTALMARNLLGVVFLAIFVKTLVATKVDSATWIIQVYVRLEQELRLVQSLAIITLLVVFLWYAIPLGRNLGAILFGYGAFVATSVLQLSIVNHFQYRAVRFWGIAQPVTYTAIVGLWLWKLWSAEEATVKVQRRSSGSDYQELANSTNRSLEEARARLGSAVRP
jgi:hypothetical protein